MMLLETESPIEMLYDQFDIWGHQGSEFLLNLNVSLGIMSHTAGTNIWTINPGMEMFVISKHVFWMLIAFFVVLFFMLMARFASGTTAGGAPKGFANFVEPIFLFIRDEVVRPNIRDPHQHHGHDVHGQGADHGHTGHTHAATHKYADRLLPYFVTLFCFIATQNLLGLIPGSSTPTSAIIVTATFASITFLIYFLGALILQGPPLIGFIKNLVPSCPIFLWPLLFVVELIGLVTKPFALTVRLFANMTAGHCLLFALAGIAITAHEALGGVGLAIGGVTTLASTAIYGLEVFVAILQAYIFTYLSAIFIGIYLVPEH